VPDLTSIQFQCHIKALILCFKQTRSNKTVKVKSNADPTPPQYETDTSPNPKTVQFHSECLQHYHDSSSVKSVAATALEDKFPLLCNNS
jgi:hypothetical protein